jgi:catechol 2,3-dioxygenase-like lactoylglutathione lyase family enzyme
MGIELNHTIVPAHDKEASAQFFARIMGLPYEGRHAHFAVVRVNDRLTLDFDRAEAFDHHHYAFKVSESDFDHIFGRIRDEGVAYGSRPDTPDDRQIAFRRGGRGFYFRDPNGHLFEVLTA